MGILNNDVIKAIRISSQKDRYAILKILQTLGQVTYVNLRKMVIKSTRIDPRFNYHLKVLRDNDLVTMYQITKTYSVSNKGKMVLEIIDKYSEKFIAEDKSDICKNDNNQNHDYIELCIKCGHIKELTKTKKQLQVIVK